MPDKEAYNITKYFNGATSVECICLECIEKIGHGGQEDGEEEN